MPIYAFEHPNTGELFEVIRPYSQSDKPFKAPDGILCNKVICAPQIKIGDEKPDRYARKDNDQEKRSKDPERARQRRRKMFGGDGISITKSPFYHKEKRIKAQGTTTDINKADFIKAAARNPTAMKKAIDIVNKGGKK
jgi:predicted nucleic acid-binding Zn ribbon protein